MVALAPVLTVQAERGLRLLQDTEKALNASHEEGLIYAILFGAVPTIAELATSRPGLSSPILSASGLPAVWSWAALR